MSNFQKKIIKQYNDAGYLVIKHIRVNKSGFPDLQAMKRGEVDLWIECKESGDTLKELQKLRIDQLIAIGKKAICLQEGKGQIYPINK